MKTYPFILKGFFVFDSLYKPQRKSSNLRRARLSGIYAGFAILRHLLWPWCGAMLNDKNSANEADASKTQSMGDEAPSSKDFLVVFVAVLLLVVLGLVAYYVFRFR